MIIDKGILKAINTTTYRASVQMATSLSVWLENVPVSLAISPAELVVGRSVAVAQFDPTNPTDRVVVAVWVDGTPPRVLVRKTANETVNNSATLQNDDALLWAVNANEVWAFHAFVRYTSEAIPDIKFGWSYPTGTTMSWGPRYATSNTAGLTEATEASVLVIPCDATNQLLAFEGIVIVSTTAGTITLQWAQNTANASDTKVLANSYLILDRLA